MNEGPGRLTVGLYRLVPVLMLLGVIAFVSGLVNHQGAFMLGGGWLFLVAGYASERARSAVGSISGYRMLDTSKRWTADRFEIGWRDNKYAQPLIAAATAEAATHGYAVQGEPVRRKGMIAVWVYYTFAKAGTNWTGEAPDR